jgi:hypothetical protein
VAKKKDSRGKAEITTGGLITFGALRCAGYIFVFEGKAYDPEGLIEDITQEQADAHNKVLSGMEISGLNKCPVGKGTYLYTARTPKCMVVKTWAGDVVSDPEDVEETDMHISFSRGGMRFRGNKEYESDAIFFKRIN